MIFRVVLLFVAVFTQHSFEVIAQEQPREFLNIQRVNDTLNIGYGAYNAEFDGYFHPYLLAPSDTIAMEGFDENLVNLFEVSPNGKYLFLESISIGWVYESEEDSILHDRWEGVMFGLEEREVVFTCHYNCGNSWNEHQFWMDGNRVVFDSNGKRDVAGKTFFDETGEYWITYDRDGNSLETGQMGLVHGCEMPVGIQSFYNESNVLWKTVEYQNWLPAVGDGCHDVIQEQCVKEYYPNGAVRSIKRFQNWYEGELAETGIWEEYDEFGGLVSTKDYGVKYNPVFYQNQFFKPFWETGTVFNTNDSLRFELSFDLHGFDCGAPDCFRTDVSFGFSFQDSIFFPEKLPFQLHEHGCVDERQFSDYFTQQSATQEMVVYYCRPRDMVLVLSREAFQGEHVYLFERVNPDEITESSLQAYLDKSYEDESKQPYLTRAMRSY